MWVVGAAASDRKDADRIDGGRAELGHGHGFKTCQVPHGTIPTIAQVSVLSRAVASEPSRFPSIGGVKPRENSNLKITPARVANSQHIYSMRPMWRPNVITSVSIGSSTLSADVTLALPASKVLYEPAFPYQGSPCPTNDHSGLVPHN